MLPFESGAMMNFFFSRVSPLTESGHGRNRCQARLSASVSASDKPDNTEVDQDFVERHAMKTIELGPRQFATSDAVHARTVAGAPRVGEFRTVHVEALSFCELLDFFRD